MKTALGATNTRDGGVAIHISDSIRTDEMPLLPRYQLKAQKYASKPADVTDEYNIVAGSREDMESALAQNQRGGRLRLSRCGAAILYVLQL